MLKGIYRASLGMLLTHAECVRRAADRTHVLELDNPVGAGRLGIASAVNEREVVRGQGDLQTGQPGRALSQLIELVRSHVANILRHGIVMKGDSILDRLDGLDDAGQSRPVEGVHAGASTARREGIAAAGRGREDIVVALLVGGHRRLQSKARGRLIGDRTTGTRSKIVWLGASLLSSEAWGSQVLRRGEPAVSWAEDGG